MRRASSAAPSRSSSCTPYAQRPSHELDVIGCGYDGSTSAQHALENARRLAAATGARLRVIRAFTPLAFDTPPGGAAIGELASSRPAAGRLPRLRPDACGLVGGVGGRLVREAACPVLVFPRSAGHTDDDSVFAKTAAAQG